MFEGVRMPGQVGLMGKLTFVDLFAGCGGLSLGLEMEGFTPVFVSELNKDAMASYLMNRREIAPHLSSENFHCHDIKNLVLKSGVMHGLRRSLREHFSLSVDNGDLDLLVGGPPCQGYSGIGHRRSYSVEKKQQPSNVLYQDMAWAISRLYPKIFLFENVKGLLSARWTASGRKGEIFEDVLSTFSGLKDYKVQHALVYARDYGTPQNRPRVLVVGVRRDVDDSAWSVDPSVASGFLPAPFGSAPDLVDLLDDLIDPDYEVIGKSDRYVNLPRTRIQRSLRTRPDGKLMRKGSLLTEQVYSRHSDKVVAKFRHMLANNGEIPPGLKTKKFSQRLLPKTWGDSGPSITATSLPDDYVHFAQPRILTVREWARLQGFPDWYQFSGSRTTGGLRRAGNPRMGMFDRELPRYTQIGNAVPVFLARALGAHFRKVLGSDLARQGGAGSSRRLRAVSA
jgi:DNA (cytosine-5)-methyltransferase 1